MFFRKIFCFMLLPALGIMCTQSPADVTLSVTYDRQSAVDYARKYAYKVVSDGYFYVNSYPATYYGAGASVPSSTGCDCAHFVSSCIGDEKHEYGGGLDVPDRAGTYGEPGAARLCNWLLSSGTAISVASVSALLPGDVIGYDWTSNGSIDHVTLYLGDGLIASHSSSHLNYSWNYGGSSFTGTFLHIVPEPGCLLLIVSGTFLAGLCRLFAVVF